MMILSKMPNHTICSTVIYKVGELGGKKEKSTIHSFHLHQRLVIFHLLFIVFQQTRNVFLFLGNLRRKV